MLSWDHLIFFFHIGHALVHLQFDFYGLEQLGCRDIWFWNFAPENDFLAAATPTTEVEVTGVSVEIRISVASTNKLLPKFFSSLSMTWRSSDAILVVGASIGQKKLFCVCRLLGWPFGRIWRRASWRPNPRSSNPDKNFFRCGSQ